MKAKEGRPVLTYVIISVFVIIMLHATVTSASSLIIDEYALRPSYFTHGMRIISIFTYMFIHADFVHLLLNCFALFCVGSIMERELGSIRFGLIFLASGVIAGLEHVITHASSADAFVGASGSIFGLLATLFLLSPFKKTQLFVVPLPAALIGFLVAAIELGSVAWASGGQLVNDVQVAGFLTGAAMSFWVDTKRAIKGLAIGAGVVIVLYMIGLFFNLI